MKQKYIHFSPRWVLNTFNEHTHKNCACSIARISVDQEMTTLPLAQNTLVPPATCWQACHGWISHSIHTSIYSGMQKECTDPNLLILWIAMSESQLILNWSCPKFVFECTSMYSTSDKNFKKSESALTYFWRIHSTGFFTQFWQNKWQFYFTVWTVNNSC